MKKKIFRPIILSLSCLAYTSVHADIGFGVGLTYVFGKSTNTGLAVGPKIFTTNEEKKVAASAGIGYVIQSASFRPNIGISYLFKDDVYVDTNVGYNLGSKKIDAGLAVGYVKTEIPTTAGAPGPSGPPGPPGP